MVLAAVGNIAGAFDSGADIRIHLAKDGPMILRVRSPIPTRRVSEGLCNPALTARVEIVREQINEFIKQ